MVPDSKRIMRTAKREARRVEVGREVWHVQRMLAAFNYRGRQYLSRTVEETMKAAECAFSLDEGDYDRASHLAKVTAFLIRRGLRSSLPVPPAGSTAGRAYAKSKGYRRRRARL